ncbi:MAG: HEAT repeat domain-containing protein [Candidatus Sericytochromatia bacterium]|nr:HEAT repeat domain-containing protein [Candidatus Sericytochromatia bacterium]
MSDSLTPSVSAFIMHRTPLALGRVLAAPALLQQSVSHYASGLWRQFLAEPACSKNLSASILPDLNSLLKILKQNRLFEERISNLIEQSLQHAETRSEAELLAIYQCFWTRPRYQKTFLLTVGRSQHPAALGFLEQIYQSAWRQPEIRQTVLRALGLHGTAPAVEKLLSLSQSNPLSDNHLRAVIMALGYSRCATSARVLEDMMTRFSDMETQGLICRALAATGSDTAVEILRKRLKARPAPAMRKVLEAAIAHAYRETPND